MTRVENLPKIAVDLVNHLDELDWKWYCVFDYGIKIPPRNIVDLVKDNIAFWDTTRHAGHWGSGCRNTALDEIQDDDTWIYFLDDDNTIHHGFQYAFQHALDQNPDAVWFIFNQLRKDGTIYLFATDRPRVNYVDTGQCVLKRWIIRDLRFDLNKYEADGIFYQTLAKEFKPIAIHESVTYYNFLR